MTKQNVIRSLKPALNLDKALILGAGRWGTAMAIYLESIGFKVSLWVNSHDSFDYIKKNYTSKYLPKYRFNAMPEVYLDINQALSNQTLVFIAVPSIFLIDVLKKIKNLADNVLLIGINKGLTGDDMDLLPNIVKSILPHNDYFHLGGPCFPGGLLDKNSIAAETIAGDNAELVKILQVRLSSKKLRLYSSDDVNGVAYMGAIKNVIAIAAGFIEGKQFNKELTSVLISRGLLEMKRLGKIHQVKQNTVYGLSGLGDLLLTCYNSIDSHNCRFGKLVATLPSVKDALNAMQHSIPEGYFTTKHLYNLAKHHQIDAPITNAVYSVLYEGNQFFDVFSQLINRPLTTE